MKLEDLKTKKAKLEFLRNQLHNDDRWIVRGLIAVYNRQTEAEKATLATKDDNGIGFSGVDGEILASFAQHAIKSGALQATKDPSTPFRIEQFMSPKQGAILRNKMPKYAGQLLKIALKQI